MQIVKAIYNEVQHVPDLFSYIQTQVDEKKQLGMYILTGSQQFGLLAKISQSLAGRVGYILHIHIIMMID